MTMPRAIGPAAVPLRAGVLDVLVGANAVCALFAIVEIPPLTLVPALYLAPAALLLADAPMRRAAASLAASRPLQWLSALLALRVTLVFVLQPMSYSVFAEVGRYVGAWLGLMSATLYAMSAPERFSRLAWTLLIAGATSALWFLLEVAGVNAFALWRQQLYTDIYAGVDESLSETIRSGLTPFRHQMGYHLAAFVPLACAVVAHRRSTRTLWGTTTVLVVIGLLAVAASLQRSSLIAVAIALVVIAVTSDRSRALASRVGASLLVAFGIAAVGLTFRPELAPAAEATLLGKIQSEEQQLDSQFRLQLQGRALELMVGHPLGLAADGVDWNEVGFRKTYESLKAAPGIYDRPFAVHNGYLVDAVQFGVGFFLLTLVLLWSVGAVVLRVLRNWRAAPAATQALLLGIAAAVVGTYSFQTLTHNASLTSMEPASVWLLALLIAGDRLCASVRSREATRIAVTGAGEPR